MKTCSTCSGTTFDDMAVCFACLQPFGASAPDPKTTILGAQFDTRENIMDIQESVSLSQELELSVEEPVSELSGEGTLLCDQPQDSSSPVEMARFHILMPELFGYDVYMRKAEDSELTVGCARDNNIVLPHMESRRHPLRIFYANDQIWVQDKKSKQKARLNGKPLTGIKNLEPGAVIKLGKVKIELVSS